MKENLRIENFSLYKRSYFLAILVIVPFPVMVNAPFTYTDVSYESLRIAQIRKSTRICSVYALGWL